MIDGLADTVPATQLDDVLQRIDRDIQHRRILRAEHDPSVI